MIVKEERALRAGRLQNIHIFLPTKHSKGIGHEVGMNIFIGLELKISVPMFLSMTCIYTFATFEWTNPLNADSWILF